MIDPEELREHRAESHTAVSDARPLPAGDDVARTHAYLARDRANDTLADARQWLARVRGDRCCIADVAREARLSEAEVRRGIEAALAAEGRGVTIATLEARPDAARLLRKPTTDDRTERVRAAFAAVPQAPRTAAGGPA